MIPSTSREEGEVWVDLDECRDVAKRRFAARGEPTRFARGVGLCDETMLSFLRGNRPPADELLHAMGWERKTVYRRVDPCPCFSCTQERVARAPSQDAFDPRLMRMFLCETCGNKRCPHATDHRNSCTGSNEVGQLGSAYENFPAFPGDQP